MAEDDNTPFSKSPSDDFDAQGISPEAEAFMPEGLNALVERPITEEDVYHLLGRYPYLEICDVNNPMKEEGAVPELRRVASGWVIHDYGNYMAVSAGVNTFGNKSLQAISKEYELAIHDEEGGSEGGAAGGGSGEGDGVLRAGTLVMQFYDTARAIMNLAKARWETTEIVGGYYPMIRSAWMAAKHMDYEIEGFTPTVEDEVVYEWDQRIRAHRGPRPRMER